MGASARYVLRVAGLAVALGLTTLVGQPLAAADDGTGPPAGAAAAEADEIRDMTHVVQSARDSNEYQEQMFDLIAEMRSQPVSAAESPGCQHDSPRPDSSC